MVVSNAWGIYVLSCGQWKIWYTEIRYQWNVIFHAPSPNWNLRNHKSEMTRWQEGKSLESWIVTYSRATCQLGTLFGDLHKKKETFIGLSHWYWEFIFLVCLFKVEQQTHTDNSDSKLIGKCGRMTTLYLELTCHSYGFFFNHVKLLNADVE